MPLDPDLLAAMPHTVKIRHRSGKTLYGDSTFTGNQVSYRAHIEPYTSRSAMSSTVESWPGYRLQIDCPGLITVDDELTMPNGDVPDIKRVSDHYDEDGVCVYQEVLA